MLRFAGRTPFARDCRSGTGRLRPEPHGTPVGMTTKVGAAARGGIGWAHASAMLRAGSMRPYSGGFAATQGRMSLSQKCARLQKPPQPRATEGILEPRRGSGRHFCDRLRMPALQDGRRETPHGPTGGVRGSSRRVRPAGRSALSMDWGCWRRRCAGVADGSASRSSGQACGPDRYGGTRQFHTRAAAGQPAFRRTARRKTGLLGFHRLGARRRSPGTTSGRLQARTPALPAPAARASPGGIPVTTPRSPPFPCALAAALGSSPIHGITP